MHIKVNRISKLLLNKIIYHMKFPCPFDWRKMWSIWSLFFWIYKKVCKDFHSFCLKASCVKKLLKFLTWITIYIITLNCHSKLCYKDLNHYLDRYLHFLTYIWCNRRIKTGQIVGNGRNMEIGIIWAVVDRALKESNKDQTKLKSLLLFMHGLWVDYIKQTC